jgi:hypothetical protein
MKNADLGFRPSAYQIRGGPMCAARCPHEPKPRTTLRRHRAMPTPPMAMLPLERSIWWHQGWVAQARTPDRPPHSLRTSQMRPPLSAREPTLSAPSFPKTWPPRPATARPPWKLPPPSVASRPCLAALHPLWAPHVHPPPPALRMLPLPSAALLQMTPRMPQCQPSLPSTRRRSAPSVSAGEQGPSAT